MLISAYACEPSKGSEPAVGWNIVNEISRFHDVWVITRENNRTAIERCQPRSSNPNVQWVYFDLPRWLSWWKKGARGVRLYYYLWQIGAFFVAKAVTREVHIDLVHHVTFAVYWRPSFLALLNVPFVWGPVGGGDSTPRSFVRTFSLRGKVYEFARSVAMRIGELDPFVRLCARRARVTLAATPQTVERLRKLSARNVVLLSQVALTNDEIDLLTGFAVRTSESVRFVSIGNLLHLKGFHLGLMAYANVHAKLGESEYWLIGDGPELKRLKKLAREFGIVSKVLFLGQLPREDVLRRLEDCDILVHPSLHDSGGWVVAEAMAAGRPVICLDIGGPSLQVTDETGIKIKASNPHQVVNEISSAMLTLSTNLELRKRMGLAGRERIKNQFNWSSTGARIREIYQRVAEEEE